MKIPIIGACFESVSRDANYQKTLNMYPISAGPDARSSAILIPSMGLKEIVDLGGNTCRGAFRAGIYVYVVMDDEVYKLTINTNTQLLENSTLLGTMGTTTGPVKFSKNPTQIMIVDSSETGYIITISTGAFAAIVDDAFQGGIHVVFCDGYFIYNEPDTAFIRSSALNNGTTWDELDVATAESKPDNLVGLAINKGELWCFGEDTVEVWFDDPTNTEGFPFSPRIGSEMDIGCAASGSIVEIDDLVMWLDSRGYIVESSHSTFIRNNNTGYAISIVSDDAFQFALSKYRVIRDAAAMTYIDRGHIMYQITFPTEKKTWVYDRKTKALTERAYYNSYTGNLEAHLAEFVCNLNNTLIVCGQSNSKVYFMSHEYKDDAGVQIRRIRRTATYSVEDKLVGVNKLELRISTGAAPATGTGSDPTIGMRYSNDGGNTWSSILSVSIGRTGEYAKPVIWYRLGTAREWTFEFIIVEPIEFSIIDGWVETSEIEAY